jgi:hypothetical protein
MSGSTVLFILLVALAALLVWLSAKSRGPAPPSPNEAIEDPAALTDAESEVSDLDASASPDDADDQLPDWGPGAPKR